MNKLLSTLILSGAIGLGFAASASAATITYESETADPKLHLVVDDAVSPGKFRFSLSTTFGEADYLGFGFNFAQSAGDPSILMSEISLFSATRKDGVSITPTLELFGDNTTSQTKCGAGCNFEGGGSASTFDYILRIGSNGGGDGGSNYVKTVVFDIAATGTLADNIFSQFAARAQATTGASTSIKADLIEVEDDPPPAVPLPAGLPLLASGVIALGAIRRRRAK